jgi:hypothetical protein
MCGPCLSHRSLQKTNVMCAAKSYTLNPIPLFFGLTPRKIIAMTIRMARLKATRTTLNQISKMTLLTFERRIVLNGPMRKRRY